MQAKLLTDTEACIHLGITKELLYAYIRNAPKKALNHNRKLVSVDVDGKNMFELTELDSFDAYLKEPWSNPEDKRPEIPSYIQEYLKTEIGGKCPITEKGYPLDNAHIEDYSISRSHHHHNIIRIAKDEHTKFDNGVLPKELLIQSKKELVESIKRRMTNLPSETTIVTYLPNVDIENIRGRHDEIDNIRKSIIEKGKVTIVNGVGGIGKTSLAQLYAKLYHHEYNYFLWIEFPNVNENSTDREVFMSGIANNFLILEFLGIPMDNKIPLENLFELVLKRIAQLPGKKLIVLDNVPNAISEFSFMLPESADFNVLGTSRGVMEDFINVNIDVLKENDSIDLFYSFYTLEKNDKLIRDILKSIGYHTLTIELISKLAIKRELTLEELYQIISKEGIKMSLEAKVISKHDKNRKPSVPFNYLCDIFDVSQLNDEQIHLLRNLAVIGSIRLSFSQLEDLLNEESDSNNFFHNLNELYQLGWVTKLNDEYYVHQLICEVVRFKLTPTFEQCTMLVISVFEHIEKSTNEFDIYLQKTYVEVSEQILNNVIIPDKINLSYRVLIARYYGFMGNHEKYNSWFSNLNVTTLDNKIKRGILINHGNILLNHGKCREAIRVLEQCKEFFTDKTTLAEVDGMIAHAYSQLGNFIKANELFEPAYKVLENDKKLSKSEFAVFINNYSHVLNGLGQLHKSLDFTLKALALREELLSKNHPLLAQSYNNIGVDYESLGKINESYSFHLKALEIREKFGDENNPDLAESYHNLASIYFQTAKHSKAKDYFEKAIKIREKAYPERSPSLVLSYCCYASLIAETDSAKAVLFYRRAFTFSEKFDFENNQHQSYWLMGFAIALFKNGEFEEALKYIDLAIDKFNKFGDTKHASNALAFRNRILANSPNVIKKKQGRNELCACGSGKKYKKCCGSLIVN